MCMCVFTGGLLTKKKCVYLQVYEGDDRLVATVYPNVDSAFIVTLIFIFDLINMGGTGI